MNQGEHFDRVRELFLRVCDLPAGQRERLLADICDQDAALREEINGLLIADAEILEAGTASGWHEPRPDERPEQVGDYRILHRLGSGGMGVVYLGEREQEGVRQLAAIKVMRRGLDTEHLLRRFDQERRILSAIRHSGVAGYLDAGETEDGRSYFVMQYVDGLPLTAYCDAHRLDVEERLSLFRKVCDAVDCVNRHLIVHRDLKPNNILVTTDGEPKLLDFGIAKFLNPELAGGIVPTAPDARFMTPEYASPEQVRGDPLTTASDVYSLGVLLYEVLSGHRPYRFGRRDQAEIVQKVCEHDPALPSTAVSRVQDAEPTSGLDTPITPDLVGRARRSESGRLRRRLQGDLDQIVMQALRKEPQRRYQSARELADDIERHLDGRPVRASADTLVYRLSKFVRRNRVAVAAAAFISVSATIGITGTGVGFVKAADARDQAHRDLHTLADVALHYVDDLERAIERLDGSLSMRDDFTRTAVDILEKATVGLDARDDRASHLALVRAYRRLGEVQGSRRGPNRGDTDLAMEAYARAEAAAESWLARSADDAQAQRELAFTLIARGDVYNGRDEHDAARQVNDRAYGILRALHDAAPRDRQRQADLAAILVIQGRDARQRWKDLDRLEQEHALARDRFTEAMRLRARLAEQDPDDEHAQRSLAVVLLRVGIVAADVGDYDEALRRYDGSVAIRRMLHERRPGDARYRRDLLTAQYLKADLLYDAARFDEAVAVLEDTAADWSIGYERNPSDVRMKRSLAMTRVLLGLLRIRQARWNDAELELNAGLTLASQLLDRRPRSAVYIELVAEARHGLAEVALASGDAVEAARLLEATLDLTKKHTAERLVTLARVHDALGASEDARTTAAEALAMLGDRGDPTATRLRSALRELEAPDDAR